MNDIPLKSGFVLPGSAHGRWLEDQKRKRRSEVRSALKIGAKVPYSAEQLAADGWGPRQIKQVTS